MLPAEHVYAAWALGSSATWGLGNVLDKLGLKGCERPSLAFIICSLVFGAVGVAMASVAGNAAAVVEFARTEPRSVAILVSSALLTSLGTFMFFEALDCTHRTHLVSAIAYTAPVFTLVAVRLLDRSTPIKPAHVLAVLMTVCGVATAVYTA